MPGTPGKFVEWLRARAPEAKNHGHKTAVARETGLSQSFANRILNGEADGNVRLETLDTIAETVGKDHVWQLVKEIEENATARTVVPIDHKIVQSWNRLFKRNPRRGQRVLENLELQEELEYTEAVSEIVRAIIRNGPGEAMPSVMAILAELTKTEDSATRRKRRKIAKTLPK